MEENKQYVAISFYKNDIIKTYKKADKEMSIIAFPKSSIYAGYVWHYPSAWIKEYDKEKQDPNFTYNADKRYISVKADSYIIITRSEINAETKQMVQVDKKDLTPDRVKEAMKRPFKQQNQNVVEDKKETEGDANNG